MPHLMTYANEIKKMAEDGVNFVAYDIALHKERAGMASQHYQPWEWNVINQNILNDLKNRCKNRTALRTIHVSRIHI